MTDSEIRIRIAERCGWTSITNNRAREYMVGCAPNEADLGLRIVPDYPNDLNAMHEVEESLSPLDLLSYESNLAKLCEGSTLRGMRATARQRAEAFLKTVGRWKE